MTFARMGPLIALMVWTFAAPAAPSCDFELGGAFPPERIDRAIEAARAEWDPGPLPGGVMMGVLSVPSARGLVVGRIASFAAATERQIFAFLRAVDPPIGRLIDERDEARASSRAGVKRLRRATRVTAVWARFGPWLERARPVRDLILSRQHWLTLEDRARLRNAGGYLATLAMLADRRDQWAAEATARAARALILSERVRNVLERVSRKDF